MYYVIIIQLRYSTIIYYTSKRYSSCQCTLCARCMCSDDIQFCSLIHVTRAAVFFSPSFMKLIAALCDANDNEGSPLCGKPVHTVTIDKSTCSNARSFQYSKTRSNYSIILLMRHDDLSEPTRSPL